MPSTCIVKLCNNNNKNSPGLSFFRIPLRNSEIPEIWAERCGLSISDLAKLQNSKTAPRICEKHFSLKDISITSAGSKKYLGKNALPIPFLAVKSRPKQCHVTKKKQTKVRAIPSLGSPTDARPSRPSVFILKSPMLSRSNVVIEGGLDDLVELEVDSYKLGAGMNPMYSSTYSPSTGENITVIVAQESHATNTLINIYSSPGQPPSIESRIDDLLKPSSSRLNTSHFADVPHVSPTREKLKQKLHKSQKSSSYYKEATSVSPTREMLKQKLHISLTSLSHYSLQE